MKRAAPSAFDEELDFCWEKCIFCQERMGKTKCPGLNVVQSQRNKGYISLAPHLEALRDFPEYLLPSGHRVDILDDGDGIQATLIARKALYHTACERMFLPPKVTALLKKLQDEQKVREEADALAEATHTPAHEPTPGPSTSRTRSKSHGVKSKTDRCFLCGRCATRFNNLHLCQTRNVEKRIKECARILGNSEILSQIVTYGDLIAQEGKYHRGCLVMLYNSARRVSCTTRKDMDEMLCESMAFADLISYLTMKILEDVQTVFVVADLVRFYSTRLANLLGVEVDDLAPIHSTRLREKIVARMPDLREQKAGRDVVLIHCKANVLLALEREDQDDNAIGFVRFVKKLRKCISETRLSFPGKFEENCEEKSVPPSLLSAVTMLLYGSNLRKKCAASKPSLTISQLILTNFHESMPEGKVIRQDRNRETPLPLYLSLYAYGYSRDRAMIDELHRLGISVSYDRIMEVTSQLCRLVVQRAEEEKVLCPGNLKQNLVTVLAVDNIDFKSRSTTSGPEFHGTGISVFQIPQENDDGLVRQLHTTFESVEQRRERSVPLLPVDFSSISESFVIPEKVEPNPAASSLAGMEPCGTFLSFWKRDIAWLSHVHRQIIDPDYCDNFSWGAFHALAEERQPTPGINAMLPLLDEKSTSPGLIRHSVDLAIRTTQHLNPGQTAVLCMDQQLYLLAKKLQWLKPTLYGEELIVMLMGGFHIEKVFLAVIGQMLEKSGWVHIVACSGVTTAGSAEGALKVSHVLRARVLHQKTAVALHSLLLDAYEEQQPEHDMNLDEWIEKTSKNSPTFYFWLLVLNLEILLLSFVKSQRQGNYLLYLETLSEMLPWIFVFDHQNYSRWLPIHLRDLLELKEKAPDVHQFFCDGKFVFTATENPFSRLPIDQAHEQNNAKVKDAGGVVGLTHDAAAIRRVMTAGPEVTRLLHEFRQTTGSHSGTGKHHEQYGAYQRQFKDHCVALINTFKSYQNPFCELGADLIALDTRESERSDSDIVKTLFCIEKTGRDKYIDFVDKRIRSQAVSFYDPIPKSCIKIFAAKKKPLHPNRHQIQMAQLKQDNQLYWRLYVASLARKLDLDTFFEYENQHSPPALSAQGKMRSGNKAELVKILESFSSAQNHPSECQGLVFDGAHLVHNVPPRKGLKTFEEYFKNQLVAHVEQAAMNVRSVVRIDFVWDLYAEHSIKNTERDSRGTGVRRKDLPLKGTIPKDWADYLKNSENKMELFQYLSTRFVSDLERYQVATNIRHTFQTRDVPSTCLCDAHCLAMEEADPRIITHVLDMTKNGAKSVIIRSTDTDVVVLAVSTYHRLSALGLQELWVHYGTGTHARYIAIHYISAALGQNKSEALPGFHAFTGCDTTSYFSGCGKPKCWKVWLGHPQLTHAFKSLSSPRLHLDDETYAALERFTVLMYDFKSALDSVILLRKDLVVSRNRSIFSIPPSPGCLRQHIQRALYQAGHLWGKALEERPEGPPSATDFGRKIEDGKLVPLWTTLPVLWAKCREVDVMCGCKTGCYTQNCSCRAANLPCCAGCKGCKGNCSNSSQEEQHPEAINLDAQDNTQEDADDPSVPHLV